MTRHSADAPRAPRPAAPTLAWWRAALPVGYAIGAGLLIGAWRWLLLTLLVAYWQIARHADAEVVICSHCGDLVQLIPGLFTRCPHCGKVVWG